MLFYKLEKKSEKLQKCMIDIILQKLNFIILSCIIKYLFVLIHKPHTNYEAKVQILNCFNRF